MGKVIYESKGERLEGLTERVYVKRREESITAKSDVALQILQAAGVDHVLVSIAIPLIIGLKATQKNRESQRL